jgi:hypothetical protein
MGSRSCVHRQRGCHLYGGLDIILADLLLLLLGLVGVALLDPEVGELAVLVPLEPRPPGRVVYRARRRPGLVGGVDLVVPHEEVPHERHLPDLVVVEPHEAVEVGAGLRADGLRRERGAVLGVAAVEEHHGRPVLARVHRLHGAVHLGGLPGRVVVVHAQHGVARVGEARQLRDVGDEEKVAVHEERPPAVAREVRSKEAGEGELGALRRAALPPVQPGLAELLLHDGDDVQRDGGAAQQGAAAHAVRDVLAGVVAHEHAERLRAVAGAGEVGRCGRHFHKDVRDTFVQS